MATECERTSKGINKDVYNAAVRPGTTIKPSQLQSVLNSTTPGGENTLLHLAASVGKLAFVEQLLNLNPQLVKSINAQGNTALHLAAQGGFSSVVKVLLPQKESGVNVRNKLNETALFKAYESGDLDTVKALFDACPSSLLERTVDERTCLNVAINRGDSALVDQILELRNAKKPELQNLKDLIHEKYKHGDTTLHVAVARNDVDIIRKLLTIEPELCYSLNENKETPLFMAVKSGHLEAVQELIKERPDAVEIPSSCGMNVLHLAAQLSQVRIVDYLNKTVGLLDLVNKGLDPAPEKKSQESRGKTNPADKKDHFSNISEGDNALEERHLQSRGNTNPADKKDHFSKMSEGDNAPEEKSLQSKGKTDPAGKKDHCEGDTPLHIAARKKHFNMVKSLLGIRGINKLAVNKEGLTAFDIVRENTEYHESNKIIAVLAIYPPKRKPFLYSAPKLSTEKQEVAIKTVNETFVARRNTELVVAVLLATMSFTAAFTIPGGFTQEEELPGSPGASPAPLPAGSPVLLGLDSFKLFLIFDCVAFFLSLFVVLMWQMSTPITTGDKVLFLCITNLLVCATFAFTAYGFMAAVYAMLDRKAHKLAWVVLGVCLFICGCGNFTFFYMVAKFSVQKARFNYLNGLLPYLTDRVGEKVWKELERWGPLDWVRSCKTKWLAIFYCRMEDSAPPKSESGGYSHDVQMQPQNRV